MALFHFSVTQVKRSAGSSVVTSAAYRAGEKLYSEYYGETSDYTHKGGVIACEIFLPPHAPREYADRQTLWNAVEKAEHGKKAQLAYSFDVALQNELTLEENMELARRFVQEQLVGRGMIADLAIHQPDKNDGIPNPHFHILCPIRPLEPDGSWGKKQRRVYRLDENGDHILGKDGKPLFDAVPTTDWGKPETLEAWRAAWADMVNAKFAEKGLTCRLDHRSYERQGIDKLATIHEGVAVRQMEAKGIPTNKGDFNRWIKTTANALQTLIKKLKSLLNQIEEIKAALSTPQSPNLAELLNAYYDTRNAGAWSSKAKTNNLKQHAATVLFLNERNLATIDDLHDYTSSIMAKARPLQESLRAKKKRIEQLEDLLTSVEDYRQNKPIYEKRGKIFFKKRRENYDAEHERELKIFYMAQRKLKPYFSEDGKLPLSSWRRELSQLREDCYRLNNEYATYYSETRELARIEACVNDVLRHQREPNRVISNDRIR